MFSRRMKLSAASGFCYRLGTGLKAGADLLAMLQSEAGYGSPRQRAEMMSIREAAKQGELLSESMKRAEPFFPPLLISMIRVGEATGRLERTLLSLAEHYKHRLALRQKFISSLAWPAIQLLLAVLVISLFIWLMGQFNMADMLGFGLTGTTGVLKFWGYLFFFALLAGGAVWAMMRNIGGVQNLIPLLYMIPVFGPALQTITLSRFCWTLSLSLDAGLDPIRSIYLALESTDSDYYKSVGKEAEVAILGGDSLSGALKTTQLFPDEFITRVEISELSGTDAESIDMLAQEYDEKAKRAVGTLAGLATGTVWLGTMGVLIFLILRIAMSIGGAYSDALQPI
ncbi:type II secretion system F family protein [Novipirellula galeiformis]